MDAATDRPVPVPDSWSLPYWQAARDGRLVMQQCASCGFVQYPPDLICRRCQHATLDVVPVTGRGHVYTFAVYTRSFSSRFDVPYVVAFVDLDDHPEVRMMTNIVGVDPDDVQIGMAVEVVFEPRGQWAIPQFQPVAVPA